MAKKKPSSPKHPSRGEPKGKNSKVLTLAAALQGGRADAAWARAADLPDQDAALDLLIRKAGSGKRLTLEQIRTVFPEIEADPDQIADLRRLLAEMRIKIINNGAHPAREPEEEVEPAEDVVSKASLELPVEVASDPVRMYLREIGRVPLLN